MEQINSVNLIDLIAELYNNNNIITTVEQIGQAIGKASRYKPFVTKDNIDSLIPDWKKYNKIIIKYTFQRRIPAIFISMHSFSNDPRIPQFHGSEHEDNLVGGEFKLRVENVLFTYNEYTSNEYIKKLFDPKVLRSFERRNIVLEIVCEGEGSDN